MNTEVAKIDPKEFGLEEKSVKDIELAFAPKIAERDGYVEIYNGLLTKEITPSLAVECGDLRKKLVKVRTGIAAVHKTQKAYFLAAGKFVDAWKNRETTPVLQMEEKLAEVEKFQEIQAKKERDELQSKRVLELTPFVEDAAERLLYGMDDDVWIAYLTAKKTEYNDRIAAEKKIEDERLAKIKEEQEEQARIRKENAKLKAEAEERERIAKIEEDKRIKAERERIAKENKEREVREATAQKEREQYQAKIKEEREANEILKRQEEAKRKALQDELKAKQDAEKLAEEQKQALIQSELNKGDAAKVKDLLVDLEGLKGKYSFKSAKNKAMYNNVCGLIDKVTGYINQ